MQSIYHRACKLQKCILQAFQDLPRPIKVLLALSGGPDSRGLFECLYELRKKQCFDLGVAHVDHGWRQTSRSEAYALKDLAEGLGIPFHLKTLKPSELQGNLEEACRKERVKFFLETCRGQGYNAVFLAHHLGDQSETVLKRIFEGASISGLSGMRSHIMREGIAFVRPWLKVPKEEILAFLDDRKIAYFKDETNEDLHFLRGKMRVLLLPYLENQFGKNISHPLERFGAEMAALEDFLQESLEPLFREIVNGPFGFWLVRRQVHPFVCEQFLRRWFKDRLKTLSYAQVADAVKLYRCKKADKMVDVKEGSIAVDRGRIFFVQPHMGKWCQEITDEASDELRGLENVWLGKLLAKVPRGNYLIGTPRQLLNEKELAYFSKRWAEEGVPRFLREMAPVLKNERGQVVEFFLKKEHLKDASFFTMNEECGKIAISVTWVRPHPN